MHLFAGDYESFAAIYMYSVSTNFRLKLIEPSAREVFTFWTLVVRENRGRVRRGELEIASELKKMLTLNLSSRRLFKLQAKISGHSLCNVQGIF